MSLHQDCDVKRIVHDSLMELMKRAGIHESLHDQVNPITHLGLDSSYGVEFACLLEEKLGIAIDPAINPLFDDKRESCSYPPGNC